MSVLNSHIEEDFIQTPMVEDEIPGHTTYLYNQHRFRKPEETVNHWKREEGATELAKRLGLEDLDTTGLVELVAEMDRRLTGLQEEVKAEVKKNEDLRLRVTKYSKDLTKAEELKAKAEDDAQDAKIEKEKAETYAERRLEELVKHGDHVVGCAYLEATFSGRRLSHQAEEDLCDCGWVQIRKTL